MFQVLGERNCYTIVRVVKSIKSKFEFNFKNSYILIIQFYSECIYATFFWTFIEIIMNSGRAWFPVIMIYSQGCH